MTFLQVGQVAQVSIIERWSWYRAALKDPSKIGSASLPIHPGEYQLGYFRTKRKDGLWEPVGIYPDDDGVVTAWRGDRQVADIPELFSWCCRYPVSYADYTAAMDGKGWPDDDATVTAQVKTPEPGPGDNSQNERVDEAEALKDQIDAALAGMKAYEKISDDATASKALSLRNRLNELSGQAEKIRVKQKEPHLEAGKAVDAKWQPLVKKAKAGADQVRDAIGAWETVKLQEQRKREREAEQARLASEQAAREASTQAEVVEAPPPVSAPEAAPTPIKAAYGKAASVSIKKVVTEVTDWAALSAYMINHPDLQACLLDLAQRATDKGHTVPGVKVEEKAAVR